jgi:carboxyl-terminal processing protease
MRNKWKALLPILFAVAIAVGIILGSQITRYSLEGNQTRGLSSNYFSSYSTTKLQSIIDLIDYEYIDPIDVDSINEKLIPELMNQLDPHSVYIPAKDRMLGSEDLEGSFSGIGVQFNIQSDTVMVISVINGGPSQKQGLQAGDRIVSVDDSVFVGKIINSEKVVRTLRGKKGTKVKLGIKRQTSDKILHYTITRGDVPVKTVDVSYVISPQIGYVKVGSFGAQTHKEFMEAMRGLKEQGASKFIIDLRGNPGGYLQAAIQMVNEFLPKKSLIVYTEGRAFAREDYYANGRGLFEKEDFVVLIDEWSASASEIFAGAMQDNDRALIIGRRSFGKGLVQEEVPLADGSAIRLTIAKYYTPSGRCIQKPYKKGNSEDYQRDIVNRYLHGEFSNKDSIRQIDTVTYRTKSGRVVYGGGGILADIFIPRDTLNQTPYYNKIVNEGYIYEYAFRFTDAHRVQLQKFTDWKSLLAYLENQPLLDNLVTFAEKKGVERNLSQIKKSELLLKRLLYSFVANNVLGDTAYYPILNLNDDVISEAITQLKKGKKFQ